jgi:hypothetical protein
MARGHSDYSLESTDQLLARKEKEKTEKGLGWPGCSTIDLSGCTLCKACVHRPENKSPLHFGKRLPPPSQAPLGHLPVTPGIINNDDLPKGYFRDVDGRISRSVTNEDGTSQLIPITQNIMIKPWLQKNPWALNFTTVTDHVQQVNIPAEIIGGMEMRKNLQGQGFMLHDGEAKTLTEFLVSWMEKLKNTRDAVVSTAPFGWSEDRGKLEGFVYGGSLWTPTGTRVAPNPDPVIANQYAPIGNLSPWLDAAKLITDQGRPDLNAILASAFAAPLVRFTNHLGLFMSAYSQESGIGKSTTMKTALAVWGDPIRAMQSLSDTSNSVMNKIGEIRSLPLLWDELKTEQDTSRLVNMVFQLDMGKEKSRLNSTSRQREPGNWQTLLVSASNESILDYVTGKTKMTTAGLYRVFEFVVAPGQSGQIAQSDAARITGKLRNNYGKVGLAYAKMLGEDFAKIDKEIGDYQRALDIEINAKTDERFWTSLITCLCVGAHYANQMNFTQIDEVQLKEFLLTTLGNLRNERNKQPVDMKDEGNISNVLAQFFSATRSRHTLFTNRIHSGAGRPVPGSIRMVGDQTRLDGVYVQIGKDDKIMRISSTYLSTWLADKGYPRHMFTKALVDECGVKQIKGRIGSGTPFAGATEYLLEVNLAGSKHLNFLDEMQ